MRDPCVPVSPSNMYCWLHPRSRVVYLFRLPQCTLTQGGSYCNAATTKPIYHICERTCVCMSLMYSFINNSKYHCYNPKVKKKPKTLIYILLSHSKINFVVFSMIKMLWFMWKNSIFGTATTELMKYCVVRVTEWHYYHNRRIIESLVNW